VRLKYTMITVLTSITTTGAFSYVFRGNSVFDPDFTGTGSQPANYDDFSAVYNQYRVWGSSIKVHVLTTTSGTEPVLWILGPRHNSTAVTYATAMDFAAQPYVKSSLQSIYRTGAKDAVFSASMTTAKFQGLSSTEFQGRDDLTALVSTNPAEQWYWQINATNVDVTVTSEVAIMVELTYDVEFFDRIDTTLDLVARFERALNIRRAFLRDRKEDIGCRTLSSNSKLDAWLISTLSGGDGKSSAAAPDSPIVVESHIPEPRRKPPFKDGREGKRTPQLRLESL